MLTLTGSSGFGKGGPVGCVPSCWGVSTRPCPVAQKATYVFLDAGFKLELNVPSSFTIHACPGPYACVKTPGEVSTNGTVTVLPLTPLNSPWIVVLPVLATPKGTSALT